PRAPTARPRRPAEARRVTARSRGRTSASAGRPAMSDSRTHLQKAAAARHSRLNPFTERWVSGELTRQQLGAWVCQHYQYVSQFPRWCAAVYADCPDADARDFLLENIVEEESGTKHVDLLIRFGEACGVSRKAVETARQ